VDFGGLLALGIVWLLFSLLGRARGDGRTGTRTTAKLPPRSSPPPSGPSADATQREGSRLERLLRELERNLEEAGAAQRPLPTRRPTIPLPDDEDVEERESLEQPAPVESLEREISRPARVTFDQDTSAEETVRRRIAAAEKRSGGLTKADHSAFDTRIRQEPADQTAVRRYTPEQLRDAMVWREILGPPVSERDG
jgi:hypothetical protein